MKSFQSEANCDGQKGFCGPDHEKDSYQHVNKPIEIYLFIDPLSYESWAFEPIIKKLYMEYGHYFMIRYVIGGRLESWNAYKQRVHGTQNNKGTFHSFSKTISRNSIQCDGELYHPPIIEPPYLAFIAIKAAELQGKRVGIRYLQKLREHLFLNNVSLTSELIYQCAKEVNLDFREFERDVYSQSAHKAFQCDVRFNFEMEVDQYPTIILFNANIEEEGIKIPGQYAYEIYTQILEEMIGEPIKKRPVGHLLQFVQHFEIVSMKEISTIFNLQQQEVERIMKQMQLQQLVQRIESVHGVFWRYLKNTSIRRIEKS